MTRSSRKPASERNAPAIPVVAPLFGFAFSLVFLYWNIPACRVIAIQAESRRWPGTNATITTSQLRSTSMGDQYWAVSFDYNVAGISYTGSWMWPGGDILEVISGDQAQALQKQFGVGTTTNVYYNSAGPAEAAVHNSFSPITRWRRLPFVAGTSLFTLLMGAVCVRAMLSTKREPG